MRAIALREMSAHTEFIWSAIRLLLDVYDDWGGLEGTFQDEFDFFARERTVHSLGAHFFSQIS